ncbi:putative apyrase 6 [Ananas comosus]|uniref:Putative apyrase 6 n=1 Tax=Ananas comosus TaxID=4615 RepID=A0A199VNE0_ANACO|nr:putative apyrase 6 [Ananas comosus]
MIDPSKLPPRPSRTSSPTPRYPRRRLLLPISAAAAAATLLYLLFAPASATSSRFGIIIDAGSSGTRIHVFGFADGGGEIPTLDLDRTAVMRVSPGLSSYAEEPDRAGESLLGLVEFAKGKVGENRRDTEIRLMATAGLRMLDGGVRDRILESCRKVLKSSGFRFQDDWATVIPGSDEGIYAWVAANYALGTLGGDPLKTTGIIELGGASAQLTFASEELIPPESSHELKFGKTTYKLYSNSFLHFGQNVAQQSLNELLRMKGAKLSGESSKEGVFVDPCTPKGYSHSVETLEVTTGGALKSKVEHHQPAVHAGGNFSECRSAALMLLQKEKGNCLYQQCRLGSSFVPELRGHFLATENFFFTSKFFGLSQTSALSDLMLAGEKFCGEDWLNLKDKYHNSGDEDISRYCFSSAYIVALLHDSLGVPLNDRRIDFANQVGDVQIEWPLGALITQRMTKASTHSNCVTAMLRNNLVLLIFVASAVLVLGAWLASRWRRPQLKTIYDLEKGRYIIMRVG